MFDTLSPQLREKLTSLPHITVEKKLHHDIDDLVAMILPPMKLTVVDDANTSRVFGDHIFKALKGRYACTHLTLPDIPVCDEETARYLKVQALSSDALVAVGGGTINDLCKQVAAADGKPYIVFPTAASMNGYLSANASVIVRGHKQTLPARMPKAVFCDLSIIADAPVRLNKSGLGDSLARSTAQADWLLSHLLLATPYDETPFEWLKSLEAELFDHARGIAKGNANSVALLVKMLLLAGLGMTAAKGSYPASQGEHMIAHAYEMLKDAVPEKQTFHGEEIGVTTLTMARMQETLLRKKPKLLKDVFDHEKMTKLFGKTVTTEAKQAFAAKQELLSNARIDNWDEIAEKITPVMIGVAKLQSVLEAADAPVTPEALGWKMQDYNVAVESARFLRERFTFLDLSPG